MATAATIRRQIEEELASRIPAALSPKSQTARAVWPTRVGAVDELLHGGLPVGALTELTGPECSGRSSLALSFVAECTRAGRICAWVDATDALSPESVAAAGVCLDRLLWVRCGVISRQETHQTFSFQLPEQCFTPVAPIKGLHGGGFGPHPRNETKGMADAVGAFLGQIHSRPLQALPQENLSVSPVADAATSVRRTALRKPWNRMEQALRATDLLLQTGGFAVIVLDMASLAPEAVLRIPLATWFRYRAAAERTQASVLLLTQSACAKSSAGLVLNFAPAVELREENTIFTGLNCRVEVVRERFQPALAKVVPLRKPPLRGTCAQWRARTAWAGMR